MGIGMRVYDCFTFFNEIELLEIRLMLLGSCVDYFVIVEANKTLRGKEKDFFLVELCEKSEIIQKYMNKIRYIQVEDMPNVIGDNQWTLEHYQRNAILRGLTDCQDDDIIMISDLDELPNPMVIKNICTCKIDCLYSGNNYKDKFKNFMYIMSLGNIAKLKKYRLEKILDISPVTFNMRLFYYYMNCEAKSKWFGTVISKFRNLSIPQYLRDHRQKYPSVNAGWHFSYLGGIKQIKAKLSAIVDDNDVLTKQMNQIQVDEIYITNCLKKGLDLYGRKGKQYSYSFIDINDIGFPLIKEVKKKYKKFIF